MCDRRSSHFINIKGVRPAEISFNLTSRIASVSLLEDGEYEETQLLNDDRKRTNFLRHLESLILQSDHDGASVFNSLLRVPIFFVFHLFGLFFYACHGADILALVDYFFGRNTVPNKTKIPFSGTHNTRPSTTSSFRDTPRPGPT